jgi:WD40 repeat protein
MADVFISYSQGAPEPTQALAAELTALRYPVWFDSRLLPMDVFWKVIREKITAAKAVIVIWSRPSIDSEWVYAEAKLAHDTKKLVCVRTADVSPAEVPMPFNGFNVALVTDRAKIYEALAKLGAQPITGSAPVLPAGERAPSEAALAWDHIKGSRDAGDFELFFQHYGEGHAFYGALAAKKIAELKGGPATARPSATAAAVPMPKAEDVFLRIEAGMHTATIRRISLTADGRLMATCSEDKTVRLWLLPDGKLVRTLRPPIGAGNDGKVYAVALAPDGSWVAAGGWHRSGEHYIFIFDTTTGAIRAHLGPLPNVILDLEVSPRGDRLAAGLGGANGIRVWESKGWRQVAEDRDYGGDVYGLSFAADGRLAATSYDGHVRLYRADGKLATKAKASGGARPSGIAFTPDGTRLAVGYYDTTRVDVLSGQTLAHLFSPDTSGVDSGSLSSVAWLADGARLAAAGRYQASGQHPIFVWSDGGKGKRETLPGPKSTVMDLAGWGQGLAFGAADPAFGLLDAAGTRVLFRGPPMADMRRRPNEQFLISANGLRLRFGLKDWGDDLWLFDLATLQLTPSPKARSDLHAGETKSLPMEGWINSTDPKLGGKALPLQEYETSRSLAVAPDAQSFVLGTEWGLRRFDKDGKPLWEQPVPGIAWGVNLARDGRLILAAYGDGTIRWHRAADGEELLALFIHVPEDPKANKRWVLWTPEGYYTAPPGAEDLIGWHVNRGPDQAADFYPADTFRSTFHSPERVQVALDKADR